MKKKIRILGLITLLCCSFYTTKELALFMKSKDPLYESIEVMKDEYYENPRDAYIDQDYMIPGLDGQQLDVDSSYQNMRQNGALELKKLVFSAIEPTISARTNKDKIIVKGNSQKNGVSFLIDNQEFSVYLEEMGISYAILTTKETMNNHYEFGKKLNDDFQNYEEVEGYLSRKKELVPYCYINQRDKKTCVQHKKYLFQETKEINKNNFAKEYNKISSGDILFLNENMGISYLKMLIYQIQFKGLKILPISTLLSETRL